MAVLLFKRQIIQILSHSETKRNFNESFREVIRDNLFGSNIETKFRPSSTKLRSSPP